MIHPTPRRRPQSGSADWLSAIFTLLVLTGIYSSMDQFSSYAPSGAPQTMHTDTGTLSSVAPPYWNQDLAYGFRSVAWDVYSASGTQKRDTVIVTSSGKTTAPHDDIRVSYYRDTSIEQIDQWLDPETPRAYSRLSHGIAVIQWDLDSPSAKTIFSTLHSD